MAVTAFSLALGCRQEKWFGVRTAACTAIVAMPLMPAIVVAEALANRGNAHTSSYRYGDPAAAVADLEAAVALEPGTARHHNSLANAYRAVSRYEDALQQYSAALRIDPAYGRATFNRAMMQLATGRLAAALADSNEAVRLQPLAAAPMTVRGNVKLLMGRAGDASRDHYEAVRLTPDFRIAYENRACSSLVLGRPVLAALDRASSDCVARSHLKDNEPPSCPLGEGYLRELARSRWQALHPPIRVMPADLQRVRCEGQRSAQIVTGTLALDRR